MCVTQNWRIGADRALMANEACSQRKEAWVPSEGTSRMRAVQVESLERASQIDPDSHHPSDVLEHAVECVS